MGYIYSDQERETEEHALPNVEVFYVDFSHSTIHRLNDEQQEELAENEIGPAGWYWVAGFPGALWDGEPSGPFNSEAEAIADAQDY